MRQRATRSLDWWSPANRRRSWRALFDVTRQAIQRAVATAPMAAGYAAAVDDGEAANRRVQPDPRPPARFESVCCKLGRLGLEPAERYERDRPGELMHVDIDDCTRPLTPRSYYETAVTAGPTTETSGSTLHADGEQPRLRAQGGPHPPGCRLSRTSTCARPWRFHRLPRQWSRRSCSRARQEHSRPP